jgi:hypothetical protein
LLTAIFTAARRQTPLVERWARLTGGLPTRSLQRFRESKRLALLLCWLCRLRTELVDTALTICNDLIAGVLRRAKHSFEKARQQQQRRMEEALKLCGEVMTLLLDQEPPDERQRVSESTVSLRRRGVTKVNPIRF